MSRSGWLRKSASRAASDKNIPIIPLQA